MRRMTMEENLEIKIPKRNTRENIIDAAIELFSEKGFSEASIRDITGRVGLRESAVYNYFDSKSAMIDVILEMFSNEVSVETYSQDNMSHHFTELGPKLFLQQRLLKLKENLTPRTIKIWRIMHIEQFRDKRVRDFYMTEILEKPVEFYQKAFEDMMEKGLIKPYSSKVLATEYYYTIVSILLERGLLEVDQMDVSPAIKKLFEHVEFFYEAIKI
jgi:AcrR family transcriptional regulator